jgi:integrase
LSKEVNMNLEIITSESGKQNPAAVYLGSLSSETTKRSQREALNIIARKLLNIEDIGRRKKGDGQLDCLLFDWSTLRYEHVSAIQTWLLSEYQSSTAQRMIAAVKGALKAAWRTGLMTSDDYMRAVDLKAINPQSNAGRMLSPGEIIALLSTCQGATVKAKRDRAIIMLMAYHTARRAEITTVQYCDYVPEYKPGVNRLVLHGKGRKDRVEFLQNGERKVLDDWIALRGSDPGPLFYLVRKSDEIIKTPLSTMTVYMTVKRRMAQAGIKNATPHDLRRTAISNLLDVTDALTAAKIAGHSNPMTTMKYDKRGEDKMIEAMGKIHMPDQETAEAV